LSLFEFYTVLLSFIVSLGMTSLLTSIGRLVQEADRVRFSWPFALWATAIFIMQVVFWLRSWSYRDVVTLEVSMALPPLGLAVIAFFVSALATPRIPDEGVIDLRAFHQNQGRKYAFAYALFMALAIGQSLIMDGPATNQDAIIDMARTAAVGGLACIAGLFRGAPVIQIGAPLLILLGISNYSLTLLSG